LADSALLGGAHQAPHRGRLDLLHPLPPGRAVPVADVLHTCHHHVHCGCKTLPPSRDCNIRLPDGLAVLAGVHYHFTPRFCIALLTMYLCIYFRHGLVPLLYFLQCTPAACTGCSLPHPKYTVSPLFTAPSAFSPSTCTFHTILGSHRRAALHLHGAAVATHYAACKTPHPTVRHTGFGKKVALFSSGMQLYTRAQVFAGTPSPYCATCTQTFLLLPFLPWFVLFLPPNTTTFCYMTCTTPPPYLCHCIFMHLSLHTTLCHLFHSPRPNSTQEGLCKPPASRHSPFSFCIHPVVTFLLWVVHPVPPPVPTPTLPTHTLLFTHPLTMGLRLFPSTVVVGTTQPAKTWTLLPPSDSRCMYTFTFPYFLHVPKFSMDPTHPSHTCTHTHTLHCTLTSLPHHGVHHTHFPHATFSPYYILHSMWFHYTTFVQTHLLYLPTHLWTPVPFLPLHNIGQDFPLAFSPHWTPLHNSCPPAHFPPPLHSSKFWCHLPALFDRLKTPAHTPHPAHHLAWAYNLFARTTRPCLLPA